MTPRERRVTVAVDAHVHLHPVFGRRRFLDAAIANAAESGLPLGPVWLLLTEIAGVHAFRELADQPPQGWRGELRADGRTLELRRADGATVLVTAGRQVQVAGGLELLALGTDDDIPDGIAMSEAIERALAADALPVVPWGFGKWWGRRGQLLEALLDSPQGASVFLGDNGGRAAFIATPGQFERVERAGRRVLPGSDPLPFARQVERVASYGLHLEIDPFQPPPFAALKARLLDPQAKVSIYGTRAGAISFLRDQVAMQLYKRRQA
ncbi:hypothetical protein SH611_08350 [Geminicoccaceae bacterium 1502E]|nr:hypothetical protein [Geminicoccaceae bacterium 1502E]